MRKLILTGLLAAVAIPGMAQAQSRAELRHDSREVRQEQRDVQRAIRNGAPDHVVRREMRDVQEARRELREDWRDYRRANPARFRGPAYVGPRGYVYRPVNVGYRFAPAYYDRRYWIDPARYRLPAAGRHDRWVRYGRDVVRIDIRNGRTLQVFSGFFF